MKDLNIYVLNRDEQIVGVLSTAETGDHIPLFSATVTEKVGSYDLLSFEVPADATAETADGKAPVIQPEYTAIFKDISGWREYVINEIEDVDGDTFRTTVSAELSSIELLDEVIDAEIVEATGNPETLLGLVLEGTRWSVGTVDASIYNSVFTGNLQYKNVLEALELISQAYNCEVEFSYTVDVNRIATRKVNLYKQIGKDAGKRFEIDKDVTAITRYTDSTGIKTAIVPYGPLPETAETDENGDPLPQGPRLDITGVSWSVANGDPVDKPLGQNYIGNPEALALWGKRNADGTKRHRKLAQEINTEDAETLLAMAWVELGKHDTPKVTYEAEVIDLYALTGDPDYIHEQVTKGDRVAVVDKYFITPITVITRIVELERDLLSPENNKLVLGNSKRSFNVGAVEDRLADLEDKVAVTAYQADSAQVSANGTNKTYRGSDTPVNPNSGDLWYRPNPTQPGYEQMLRYNGNTWDLLSDSYDLADAGRLTFGTIDAGEVNVINLNASNISAGDLDVANVRVVNGDQEVLTVDGSTGAVTMNVSSIKVNAVPVATQTDIENIELTPGPPGEDAYRVEILSSNGSIFKNGDINTVLTARVYQGADDITDSINASAFRWQRVSADPVADSLWNMEYSGGVKEITLTPEDVSVRATFNCSINI